MPRTDIYRSYAARKICPDCCTRHSYSTVYCKSCLKKNRQHDILRRPPKRANPVLCVDCNISIETKPTGEIPKRCKDCRKKRALAYANTYYKIHRQHIMLRSRKYYGKNRDRYRAKGTSTSLYQRYKITRDEYEALFNLQNGKCAICQTEIYSFDSPTKFRRNTHVDHSHSNGKIRGLLCNKCNLALGLLNDNIEKAGALLAYLMKHLK